MATWLDKIVKVLALALDTRVEHERKAAMAIAADLAAKHQHSLGWVYLRIERAMPDAFRYLEAKRAVAGLASFVCEADAASAAERCDPDLAPYTGNRAAHEAMLSCTVRPLSCRGVVRRPAAGAG